MVLYDKDFKLSVIINKDYSLLPVINRLGIRLGFGDKTVSEVCKEQNVNLDFFIDIINIFHNENYFPQKQLLNYPINLVTTYLSQTHRYYIDFILSEIERSLNLIVSECPKDNSQLKLLQSFYLKFKDSFIKHTKNEEQNIFPYACDLSKLVSENTNATDFIPKYKNLLNLNFEEEHSLIDEKMADLKNIIIKYLPPVYEPIYMNALLHTLFLFEKDLKNHAHIEDKILIPKINMLKQSAFHGNV